VAAVALSLSAQSKQKIFHLAIGDAERLKREARVVLDRITDTATGEVISADRLPHACATRGCCWWVNRTPQPIFTACSCG